MFGARFSDSHLINETFKLLLGCFDSASDTMVLLDPFSPKIYPDAVAGTVALADIETTGAGADGSMSLGVAVQV